MRLGTFMHSSLSPPYAMGLSHVTLHESGQAGAAEREGALSLFSITVHE